LGNLGVPEILVIVVVALLVFGPNKVPEVARQVGRGMRELRRLQDSLRGDFADLLDLGDDDHDEPTAPFHPTATAPSPSLPAARPLGPPSRPLPGPPPAAAPSRFRTPTGTRVESVPHERPALPTPAPVTSTMPAARPASAPSRFRPPPRPDAS
jgi:TatA/E family protein of Tat protein translocase